MQILEQDRNRQWLHLYIDTLDDLWTLATVLETGDHVTTLTSRREESRDDMIRSSRGENIKMRLTIEVEELKFHEFSNWLRVQGVIRAGPQSVGSHHTFNLEPGNELEAQKERWTQFHLEEINEAVRRTTQPNTLLIAIEDDNATVAVLHQYGVQTVASIDRQGMGKQYETREDSRDDFFAEVLLSVRAVLSRADRTPPIIVLGPGFIKEDLRHYLEDALDDEIELYLDSTAHAGLTGIHEAMKRGLIGKVVEGSRMEKETRLVEQLLERIAKSDRVTYGPKEVERALMVAAVDTLLVLDRVMKEERGEKLYEAAQSTGATVHVISSVHEAGEKLEALGGLGAFLRFEFQ